MTQNYQRLSHFSECALQPVVKLIFPRRPCYKLVRCDGSSPNRSPAILSGFYCGVESSPVAYYPERKWWESLRCADIRDQFRSVARVNSVNDESYFERQRTYLLRQSDSAVDFQMPSPRIAENPASALEDNRGRRRSRAKRIEPSRSRALVPA
jgi:hypothetical protein